MKLDVKVQAGKEAVARTVANTTANVRLAFTTMWEKAEAAREARRQVQLEQQKQLEAMEKYNTELDMHNAKVSRPSSIMTGKDSVDGSESSSGIPFLHLPSGTVTILTA